jgi:Cu/Ag efflux protein CusF
MRKLATIFMVVLTAFAFITGVAAAGGQKAAGEVIKADQAGKSIVLNVDGKQVTMTVSEEAAKTLGNLKPGDKVTVSYDEAGGTQTVSSIEKQM